MARVIQCKKLEGPDPQFFWQDSRVHYAIAFSQTKFSVLGFPPPSIFFLLYLFHLYHFGSLPIPTLSFFIVPPSYFPLPLSSYTLHSSSSTSIPPSPPISSSLPLANLSSLNLNYLGGPYPSSPSKSLPLSIHVPISSTSSHPLAIPRLPHLLNPSSTPFHQL